MSFLIPGLNLKHKPFHQYSQSFPSLFTNLSITIHKPFHHYSQTFPSLFTNLSIAIHKPFHRYSQTFPSLFTNLSIAIHKPFHHCSQTFPSLFTNLSITIHKPFHRYSQTFPSLFTNLSIAIQTKQQRPCGAVQGSGVGIDGGLTHVRETLTGWSLFTLQELQVSHGFQVNNWNNLLCLTYEVKLYIQVLGYVHTNHGRMTTRVFCSFVAMKVFISNRRRVSIFFGLWSLLKSYLQSYFSFQPVLHDWCNKGYGMCYPVCGGDAYKRTLAANRKK